MKLVLITAGILASACPIFASTVEPFPAQQPVAPEAQLDLRRELDDIYQRDQSVRQRLDALGIRDGLPIPEVFMDEWRRIDADNLKRIRAIISRHGWPGSSIAGPQGSMAAFLVIQHADLATQKELLPMIEKAAADGELQKGTVAYLVDRIRIRDGQKQIYGTQARLGEDGRYVPEPLEDEAKVDDLRREVGLPPLDLYMRGMNDRNAATSSQTGPAVNQALRLEIVKLQDEYRRIGPEFSETVTRDEKTWPADLRQKREEARARITAWMTKVMDEHGFPGPALLAQDGARIFFNLLPDAPIQVQNRALELMAAARDNGQVSKPQFAWLSDRCRVAQGRPQLYGTQVERSPDGSIVPKPIDDAAAVDDRRAQYGLGPMKEFLAALNGPDQTRSRAD